MIPRVGHKPSAARSPRVRYLAQVYVRMLSRKIGSGYPASRARCHSPAWDTCSKQAVRSHPSSAACCWYFSAVVALVAALHTASHGDGPAALAKKPSVSCWALHRLMTGRRMRVQTRAMARYTPIGRRLVAPSGRMSGARRSCVALGKLLVIPAQVRRVARTSVASSDCSP